MKCTAYIDPQTGIALEGEALVTVSKNPDAMRCGYELESGDRFCPSCGIRVEAVHADPQTMDSNAQTEASQIKDTSRSGTYLFLERIPCSRWVRVGYAAVTVVLALLTILLFVMICGGGTKHLMFRGIVILIGAIVATFRSLLMTLGDDSARDMDRANHGKASALFNIGIALYKNEITVTKEDEIVASGQSGAFEYFMRAAVAGNAKGMFNAAVCLEHGIGCEPDKVRALALYRNATEKGLDEAFEQAERLKAEMSACGAKEEQADSKPATTEKVVPIGLIIGIVLGSIIVVFIIVMVVILTHVGKHDNTSSVHDRSVQKYDRGVDAYNKGLDFYERGDFAQAVFWYRKAAEQGNASAQLNLGCRYFNGEGVEQNKAEAVKWFRKSADQGEAKAQYNLGVCYSNGRGVEQDKAEAVKWYRKAAEQGDADAQNNLAVCFDNGEGVEQDKAEAVKWYRKAAERGESRAQYNLAICYENGEGMEQDKAEAVKWYRKAAEQGHSEAQNQLGTMYYIGKGVKENDSEAVKWYRKAAEQGHVAAQRQLGFMYRIGIGIKEDKVEAVKWYRKAAEQGDADAQYNLGNCYGRGEGVEQDKAEAVKWYHKAAEQGNKNAKEALKRLGVDSE